jgi:murein DD-endopeptidase MepM/ murein hydrolase activator NlpD
MTSPVPGAKIGNPYKAPGPYALGYHTGVDYPVRVGTRVEAPAGSTIVYAGRYRGWGRAYGVHIIGECVVAGVRYRWMVAHLSKIREGAGSHVAAGQYIGLSGNTGNSTGPHVHFEVRRSPYRYGDDVNPAVLINHKPGTVDRMDPNNYGPGRVGSHITQYGQRLVALGYGDHYQQGPGPVWGEADRLNTRDFQRAQGWTGEDANWLPGPETLRRVFG